MPGGDVDVEIDADDRVTLRGVSQPVLAGCWSAVLGGSFHDDE
jgi:hypothetical protein